MSNLKRDTNADLMNNVLALVKQNGCYEKAEAIMDYFLPEDFHLKELSDAAFDFLTKLNFGGSEGIYLDCYICGEYDDATKNTQSILPCGTFKTLQDDLEAMQIMGELAGSLIYYARIYLNQEYERYCRKEKKEL